MNNYKLISNFGAGIAIVCILFLPFVGCGGANLTGADVLKHNQIEAEIKIFIVAAVIFGVIIFFLKAHLQIAISAIAGAVSLLIAYLIAHNKNSGIELKTGAYLALIGYAGTALTNILGKSTLNKDAEVNFSSPVQATTQSDETISNTNIQAVVQPEQKTGGFDFAEWFKINNKKLIIVFASIAVLYGVYYFLLRNDPEKDGKKAATSYCDCNEKENENLIKANEEFLSTYSNNNYKTRLEARQKQSDLQFPYDAATLDCQTLAEEKYNKLRNKYLTNEEGLKTFDFAFSAQQGICNPKNQTKLNSIISEIGSKISTIKDPEPDIEKIKSDLIGQQIPGWNFSYLNEFKSALILNTTRGSDRIEFQIKFQFRDNATNSEHDCEVMVVYSQGDEGWNFNNVKEQYITYTNTAIVNQWGKVKPLENCNYKIIDNGQKFWVQDGTYGTKFKGGGNDADAYYLRSTEVFIMSREDHPVDLVFKYTPTN